MAKKRKYDRLPYGHNENISVYYEYQFGKDLIVPGTKLKFANTRGEFKFLKYVKNSERSVQWIDCMDVKTGEYRAFYTEKLKRVVKPKRARKKKVGSGT